MLRWQQSVEYKVILSAVTVASDNNFILFVLKTMFTFDFQKLFTAENAFLSLSRDGSTKNPARVIKEFSGKYQGVPIPTQQLIRKLDKKFENT